MHKLLRYSGVQCKNTETNIFVYGGKRVKLTISPQGLHSSLKPIRSS